MVAFLLGGEHHPAGARLAGGLALLGGLDAVVDGVAHQVHQRVGQGLDQVLVQVSVLAHQLEVDFFLQVARQVADQAREAAEDLLDRLHAGFHHRGLQVGGDHVQVGHGLGHGLVAAVQAQAHQAITHQHQLADHVHDLVQPCGIDPYGGLRFAGHGRAGGAVAGGWRAGLARCGFDGLGQRPGCGRRAARRRGCGSRSGGSHRLFDGAAKGTLAVELVQQGFEFVVGDVVAASGRRCRRRDRRSRRTGGDVQRSAELALAMQLVEQVLELVVADLVTGARRGHGRSAGMDGDSGFRLHRGGELALAVQLVEERFEFVVGDFVGSGDDRFGSAAGVIAQGVQQLFELAVGDVGRGCDSRRSCGHGGHRGSRCGCGFSAARLGQTRQRGEQLGGGRRRFAALAHFAEHLVDRIQRLQDHVHQLGIHAAFALAQDVEDVLGDMAALHQGIELEEAGAALHGMETTENRVEQVHVVRAAFQLDQLLGQLLQNLAGLYQEVLEDFFIGVEAHMSAP
ncbi:hypothetical protein D9M68_327950 [compost metagenome]